MSAGTIIRSSGAGDVGAWVPVSQGPADVGHEAISLLLKPQREGKPVKLWVSVTPKLARVLGWRAGMDVALAEGIGSLTGWLRLEPADVGKGRTLKALGRSAYGPSLHAMMQPPSSLAGLEAERAECEHKAFGNAVEVRIPWDLTAARAELAEQVAA
jgi:hypothetical protein